MNESNNNDNDWRMNDNDETWPMIMKVIVLMILIND